MLRYILPILLLLINATGWCYNLSVTASGGDSWSDGVYEVTVGDTITFSCTASSGSVPYDLSINYDDLDTYENGEDTVTDDADGVFPNQTHTFDFLGLHYVWYTVTDDNGDEEKAVLLVDVKISSSENRVDVTDSGDVGAGNVLYNDGTNPSTNSSRLATIISTYYNSTNGLTLYFPSGTYKFQDSGNTDGGDDYYAILFPSSSKIILEGDRNDRPTLEFYNTHRSDLSNPDGFIYRPTNAGYVLLRRCIFKWNGDAAINNFDRQALLFDPDDETVGLYVTIEDSDIQDYTTGGSWHKTIFRRNSMSGFGRCDGDGPQQGFQQALYGRSDTLFRWNYLANGNGNCYDTSQGVRCGHSKLWYTQSLSNSHVIENYGDSTYMEENVQDVVVFKQSVQDVRFEGNLLRNATGSFIQVGHTSDGPADDFTIKDNIFIDGTDEKAILIYASLTDILIDGNFTANTIDFFTAGVDNCTKDSALGITYSNNETGENDSLNVSCAFNCGGDPTCSITNGGGNTSTSNAYRSTDPAGWISGGTYANPGKWETVQPTNNSGESASDSGSGIGSSARFPFYEGALAQGEDGSNNYSQVELYASKSNLSSWSEIRFADVDHNWSTLETFSAGDSTPPVITIDQSSPQNLSFNSLSITGNATDASGTIGVCKYRIGSEPDGDNGTALIADDGTFDEADEDWHGTVSGFSPGANTLYIECDDDSNNWSTGHSISVNYSPVGATGIRLSDLGVVF